jgi:hypothetical protein
MLKVTKTYLSRCPCQTTPPKPSTLHLWLIGCGMLGCGSKRVKARFIRRGMSRSSENVENTSTACSAIIKELPVDKEYVNIDLEFCRRARLVNENAP